MSREIANLDYIEPLQGAFFVLLVTLSISVVFRTVFSIVSLIFSSLLNDSTLPYRLFTQSSLYVDYILTFFSMVLIFLMSLNRCFLFIAPDWDNILFHQFRVVIPISISALLSVLASVIIIITSEIERKFIDFLGFVDMGKRSGLRNVCCVFSFPLQHILPGHQQVFLHFPHRIYHLLPSFILSHPTKNTRTLGFQPAESRKTQSFRADSHQRSVLRGEIGSEWTVLIRLITDNVGDQ